MGGFPRFSVSAFLGTSTTLTPSAEVTAELSDQRRVGSSAVDLMITKRPDIATMLARLALDDATSLITERPVIEAMITVARESTTDDGPSEQTRAAIASTTVLGGVLFGPYLSDATGNDLDEEILETLRDLITQFLIGAWPDPSATALKSRK